MGPLTHSQGGAPGHLINNQGALEPLTDDQGAPGLMTDAQGSRAKGLLIQIFNNIYICETNEKSKSFVLKVATPGPRLTLL